MNKNNIYKCPFCTKTFKIFSLMSKHKSKHLKKPHQCEKCPETYNILDNLVLHNVTHSKELIKCPKCDKYFNRLSSLRGHIKIHFKNEYYTCVHCEESFVYESLLAEHINTVHTGSKRNNVDPLKRHKDLKRSRKHICEVCKKVFTKPCLLERHVRIHYNTRPYQCELCSKAFHQMATLQMHYRTHNGSKPYKCTQCFQCFAQKGNLNIHMKRVHTSIDNSDNQYPCSYCTCVFSHLGSLNRHISQYHPNFKQHHNIQEIDNFHYNIKHVISQLQQLQVPESGINHAENASKTTNTIEQLPVQQPDNKISEYSADSMTENKSSPQKCFVKMADRLPNGIIVFRTVEQRIINNTRVFICEYCSKVMKRPSDFLRHLRVHTKEKPFECTICHRYFAIKSTLSTHMRTHDNKVKHTNSTSRVNCKSMDNHIMNNKNHKSIFHCTECTQIFANTDELKVHRKQHKTHMEMTPIEIPPKEKDEANTLELIESTKKKSKRKLFTGADKQRPFACNICHASFRQNDDLNCHIISHNNRRLFKCILCDKYFSTETSLNIHKKTHFKAINSKPQTCQVCLKDFSTHNLLKLHMRNHNSNIMYMCMYCKKLFKSKFYCRKHIRLHRMEGINKDQKLEEEMKIVIDNIVQQPIDEISIVTDNNDQILSAKENSSDIVSDLDYVDNTVETDQNIVFKSIEEIDNAIKPVENTIMTHEIDDFETFTDPNELKYFLIVDNQIVLISEEQHKQITKDIENSDESNKNQQIILESVEFQPFAAKTTSSGSELTISFDKNIEDTSVEHYLQLTNLNLDGDKLTTFENRNKSVDFLDDIECLVETNDVPVDDFNLINANQKSLLKIINPRSNLHYNEQKTIVGDKTIEFILQPIREDDSEIEDNPDNYLCLNSNSLHDEIIPFNETVETEFNEKNTTKLLQCPHCPKTLKKPIDLKRHLRTHTGERPFKCTICDKSFALLCTLKTHKKVHTDNKKIEECHICANKFSSKGSLRIHMRIHSGEKPHHCPYCPQSFRTSGHRKSHLKGHLKQANEMGIHPSETKPRNCKLSHLIEALNERFNKD